MNWKAAQATAIVNRTISSQPKETIAIFGALFEEPNKHDIITTIKRERKREKKSNPAVLTR